MSAARVVTVCGRELMLVRTEMVAVRVDGIDHECMFRTVDEAERFVERLIPTGRRCEQVPVRSFCVVDLTAIEAAATQEEASS